MAHGTTLVYEFTRQVEIRTATTVADAVATASGLRKLHRWTVVIQLSSRVDQVTAHAWPHPDDVSRSDRRALYRCCPPRHLAAIFPDGTIAALDLGAVAGSRVLRAPSFSGWATYDTLHAVELAVPAVGDALRSLGAVRPPLVDWRFAPRAGAVSVALTDDRDRLLPRWAASLAGQRMTWRDRASESFRNPLLVSAIWRASDQKDESESLECLSDDDTSRVAKAPTPEPRNAAGRYRVVANAYQYAALTTVDQNAWIVAQQTIRPRAPQSQPSPSQSHPMHLKLCSTSLRPDSEGGGGGGDDNDKSSTGYWFDHVTVLPRSRSIVCKMHIDIFPRLGASVWLQVYDGESAAHKVTYALHPDVRDAVVLGKLPNDDLLLFLFSNALLDHPTHQPTILLAFRASTGHCRVAAPDFEGDTALWLPPCAAATADRDAEIRLALAVVPLAVTQLVCAYATVAVDDDD
jgi:hypothetical protein